MLISIRHELSQAGRIPLLACVPFYGLQAFSKGAESVKGPLCEAWKIFFDFSFQQAGSTLIASRSFVLP